MSYLMSQHCTCIGHMTFYYKWSANASVQGSCLLFVHLSGLTLSPETHRWLVPIGRDTSRVSPAWSLLPSTVIIVLALVNSAMSQAGTSSISTRPGSAPLLPVSTASTGLLRLSVGARVHCVRSDTEKYRVWLLLLVFKWQPFWYFSLICYPAHTDRHRDFILHILTYLFFTFIHKSNSTNIAYFSEICEHFLEIHILFTSH